VRLTSGAVTVEDTPRRIGDGRFALGLDHGELWIETDKRFEGNRLVVRTGDVDIVLLGTVVRVAARPNEGSSVDVFRGRVVVSAADEDASQVVAAGQSARVERGDVRIERIEEPDLSLANQRQAFLRAPSMILGTGEYFMPTDSIAPEMGLALGWDADRAARVVDCDLPSGGRGQLRLIRGAEIPRWLLGALDRAALLETQASASQDRREASRLYVEAAAELKTAAEHRPHPAVDAPLLVFAAHLESVGARRPRLAFETLGRAQMAAGDTPLEPVVVLSKALLLEDRLGRPQEAGELYRSIITRFGTSPEAAVARQRLGLGASAHEAGS
jgi:hypothetical protein